MTTVTEISLTPVAQTFTITLAGTAYQMTLIWRNACGWVLDIADISGNPIVRGIVLVTGCDLLGPYTDLDFGGQLFVQTDGGVDAPPTYTNLGIASHLYWLTEP